MVITYALGMIGLFPAQSLCAEPTDFVIVSVLHWEVHLVGTGVNNTVF